MAQKLYKRSGLKRDNNLSDLQNSTEGLNNLLGPLVDISDDATFISEDLNCIRGLSNTNINSQQFQSFANVTLTQTNENGVESTVLPLRTFKNTVDILEITSGDPRLNGGPGIFPKFYSSVNGDGYTDEDLVSGSGNELTNLEKNELEWLNGTFEFRGKIRNREITNKGAYVWEGFFIPTQDGVYSFSISTSGYIRLEFQDSSYTGVGIGTYVTKIKTGITTTITANGTASSDRISGISAADRIVVGTGMTISGANIAADSRILTRNSSSDYTLSNENGDAITSNFNGQTVTLFKDKLGELSTRHICSTHTLNKYEKYYFKLTYFIPNSYSEQESEVEHRLDLNLTGPGRRTSTIFPYTFLYPLDYDFSDFAAGTFDTFSQENLPKSGGSIGSTETSANYVSVNTSSQVKINYNPPSSLSSVKIKTLTSASLTSDDILISSRNTDGIEEGNYVFSIGSGISTGTRVKSVNTNSEIILDTPPTITGTRTIEIFDHKGFVKKVIGSISGTTLTISEGDTDALRTGMLVVGDGVTQYTGITTTGSNTTVTINESQTVGAGTSLYFYQSAGLINNSLVSFCPETETRCLVVDGIQASGSTQLTVISTAGISVGENVYGAQFAEGTTIDTINDSTTLTLSSATINALADGANFAVSSSDNEQKIICCSPTDTSPPFNSTEEGIDTSSSFPSINVEGTVSFDSLSIGVSTVVSTYSGSGNESNNRFTIGTPNGNFDVLCA